MGVKEAQDDIRSRNGQKYPAEEVLRRVVPWEKIKDYFIGNLPIKGRRRKLNFMGHYRVILKK